MGLPARGSWEKEEDTVVRVTGIVRMVGSGFMPEIVITGSEMEWYIEKEEEDKLRDLQYRTVTVEGIETVTNLIFGNGLPAGERRTLKKIKIISIE